MITVTECHSVDVCASWWIYTLFLRASYKLFEVESRRSPPSFLPGAHSRFPPPIDVALTLWYVWHRSLLGLRSTTSFVTAYRCSYVRLFDGTVPSKVTIPILTRTCSLLHSEALVTTLLRLLSTHHSSCLAFEWADTVSYFASSHNSVVYLYFVAIYFSRDEKRCAWLTVYNPIFCEQSICASPLHLFLGSGRWNLRGVFWGRGWRYWLPPRPRLGRLA